MSTSPLTPEQDRELDALVRIAHVIGYQKDMPFDEFDGKLRFMLMCLFSYWQVDSPEKARALMARVVEIAAQQKAEMMSEIQNRGLQA